MLSEGSWRVTHRKLGLVALSADTGHQYHYTPIWREEETLRNGILRRTRVPFPGELIS